MKTVNITETSAGTAVVVPVVTKRAVGRPKTKVTLKRVVLLDGKPVGRGRPVKGSKGKRTAVFIPVDETYDVAVHGLGAKYRADKNQFKQPIKRVNISSYRKFVNKPATPAVTTKPVEAVEITTAVTELASVAQQQ